LYPFIRNSVLCVLFQQTLYGVALHFRTGDVLVCWSHGHIRPIVLALGAEDPRNWDEDIYDQVYMITFENGKDPKFQKILQKLMFGDRTTFEDKSPSPLPK